MTTRPPVHIVATGSANLASVCALVTRIGAEPIITTDPALVRSCERLILPGVGSFAHAMESLRARALDAAIIDRITRDEHPTLTICLGMQVLFESSEESPGVQGLALAPGHITRLAPSDSSIRVPQLGWNRVTPSPAFTAAHAGFAYFANSFCLRTCPPGWAPALTTYDQPFISAIHRGRTLACQFHPELSGDWGQSLVARWLNLAPAIASTSSPTASDSPITTCLPRIIPCLDVRDGRVVKGVQFQNLRDSGSPDELAHRYQLQGADELVMLDVSATHEARATAAETVARIRARISIPLTVGGGVRTPDDAARLLDAGADKVAVNTAAVTDPSLIARLADRFGTQCVVLAIDAAPSATAPDTFDVVVRSGTSNTRLDARTWAQRAQQLGAGEILLTSIRADGTRTGYDLPLLRAICSAVNIPVIASGGASSPDDLAQALRAGADAVLAASIFHDSNYTVSQVKDALSSQGIPVRPC
jgi:imidazole glycerol phosphate synthase glutamine amidotransferase subunit